MAERTVTVRLKALVDDYKRAMAGAATATQDVARQAGNWKSLGQSAAGLGDSLTRNLTLPILAVGAAALKMSMDFDAPFQQMVQLAGVSASEIDGLKDSVLGLAGETGKAPTELAEALYFLRSSGLDSAAAMDALEMSAMASAAGLGSTVQIADAVSSAMNAYASSGLSAAEATDVLVATAREGKAEPGELAAQMGRLLPVSSELGITFNDVGAALAALSNSGNDAAASSTQLSALMSKLLRPSQQAMEALNGVGISLDDIRTMISEQGLLGTLQTLRESLGDAGFTAFLEDQQAVQAGLALTGDQAAANEEIFRSLADAAGSTESAFAAWGETMGAKNAKAWAELQAALIRLGDAIAPIAADIAQFAGSVIRAFSEMSPWMQKAVLGFLAVAAAIGPLLSVGGRLVSAGASVVSAIANWAGAAGQIAPAFNGAASASSGFMQSLGGWGPVGVAAGATIGLGLAVDAYSKSVRAARAADMAEAFLATGDAAEASSRALEGGLDGWRDFAGIFNDVLAQSPELAAEFLNQAEAAGVHSAMIERGRDALEQHVAAQENVAAAEGGTTGALGEGTDAFDAEAAAVTAAVEALNAHADAINAQFDPLFGLNSALTANRDAQRGVEEAQHNLTVAQQEHGASSLEAMAAQEALTDAMFEAGQSAVGVTTAEIALAAALEEQPELIGNVNTMLDQFVASGLITQEEAMILADRFGVLGERVEDVPDRSHTDVSESGSGNVRRGIFGVVDMAGRVPGSRHTNVTERGAGGVAGALDGVSKAAHRVPKSVTVTTYYKQVGGPVPKAKGGRVQAREVYRVGEEGEELFVPDGPGEIIPHGRIDAYLGQMSSSGAGAGGGGGFGGVTTIVNVSMAGALVSNSADAQRWVAAAWNKAAAIGMVNVRGRSVAA